MHKIYFTNSDEFTKAHQDIFTFNSNFPMLRGEKYYLYDIEHMLTLLKK